MTITTNRRVDDFTAWYEFHVFDGGILDTTGSAVSHWPGSCR